MGQDPKWVAMELEVGPDNAQKPVSNSFYKRIMDSGVLRIDQQV